MRSVVTWRFYGQLTTRTMKASLGDVTPRMAFKSPGAALDGEIRIVPSRARGALPNSDARIASLASHTAWSSARIEPPNHPSHRLPPPPPKR